MAEPRPEQIAAAIRTKLEEISGDGGATYWYTPDRVIRSHAVTDRLLDGSLQTLYVVTPDRKDENRRTNGGPGCIVRGIAFLTLTLLHRFTPPTENALVVTPADEPIRWTIQERMEGDVRKKLREDPKLGGISTDLDLTASEEGADETFIEGWALAFVRLQVTYHYVQETP